MALYISISILEYLTSPEIDNRRQTNEYLQGEIKKWWLKESSEFEAKLEILNNLKITF